MARNRDFDETTVLSGAMHAFRRAGLRNATVQDIERVTGVSVGSLYNAFGNKSGLYQAAARHYVDTIVHARLRPLNAPGARIEDMEDYILTTLRPPFSDGFGCLVANSVLEFPLGDPADTSFTGEALQAVKAAFLSVIAQDLPQSDAEQEALRMLALYQGILLLSRAGWDVRRLAAMVEEEFDRLKQARSRQSNKEKRQC